MTDSNRIEAPIRDAQEAAGARRERQERQNPSGHGMQVTPRQQQHVAESSDQSPPATAETDGQTLEDLKM